MTFKLGVFVKFRILWKAAQMVPFYVSFKNINKKIGCRPPLSSQLWQIQDGRHFLCKIIQNAIKNELMNLELCFWCLIICFKGQGIS